MSAYVPRHAPLLRHHHPAVLAVTALALAVAVLGVILASLALSRPAPAALSAPVPSSGAPAPVHAAPRPVASQRPSAPRAAAPLPYVVQPDDSLWSISAWYYGDGSAWPRVYAANRAVIGPDPDLIRPGERLTFP